MSIANAPIDDEKPAADRQEQSRDALEEPDDPETSVTPSTPLDGTDADAADVADQREEVPLDDDWRDD